ncbi:hypothetical protein NDU88_005675 [Pleurodeles waltl]|uniref:Secreted protein n=1 Tax=Pleurodeles waltl TaxID=8319 RepID=A0AAV7QJK0_PLEWA|nr:hypothetical protein NDU88_005675 [Pleurodeles waltl]
MTALPSDATPTVTVVTVVLVLNPAGQASLGGSCSRRRLRPRRWSVFAASMPRLLQSTPKHSKSSSRAWLPGCRVARLPDCRIAGLLVTGFQQSRAAACRALRPLTGSEPSRSGHARPEAAGDLSGANGPELASTLSLKRATRPVPCVRSASGLLNRTTKAIH